MEVLCTLDTTYVVLPRMALGYGYNTYRQAFVAVTHELKVKLSSARSEGVWGSGDIAPLTLKTRHQTEMIGHLIVPAFLLLVAIVGPKTGPCEQNDILPRDQTTIPRPSNPWPGHCTAYSIQFYSILYSNVCL